MATAAACLVALAALAAAVAANGTEGVLVGVLDVVMLVATVGWFLIAVARRGSDVVTRHPSFEGSTDPAASR
jgi:hypothetical protein